MSIGNVWVIATKSGFVAQYPRNSAILYMLLTPCAVCETRVCAQVRNIWDPAMFGPIEKNINDVFCDFSVHEKDWCTASKAFECMRNTLSHMPKT